MEQEWRQERHPYTQIALSLSKDKRQRDMGMKVRQHFRLDFSLAGLVPILRIATSPGTNSSREPCPECGTQWRSRLFGNGLKQAVRRIWLPFLLTAVILVPFCAPVLAQINSKQSKIEGEVGTRATVLTEKDTILLADFENKTGDAVFGEALKQALAIELGQSPFLNLLSDGKVKETLQIMGRSTNDPITADMARKVCLRTDSKAILTGTISRSGGHYMLDLDARACGTGDTLAEEHNDSVSKEDVLKSLSQASSNLREKLGEPLSSVERFTTPVDATTTSVDALKNYSIGTSLQREKGDAPSVPFLKRAIEFDPNFPLPYAALAAVYRNLRQPSLALEYATKAYKLCDRLNVREKLRISAAYYSATGELEKEIETYERWEASYPRDFTPHNNLGNDYFGLGQLDKALTEYQKAVRVAPSVAGYSNVMGADLSLDLLDEAQATFDEACAQKLDGRYVRQTFYWLAFLKQDAAQMDQQVAWAAGKMGDEDALLSVHSDTEAYYGRLSKARDFTRRAVNSAVRAESNETAALWQVNSALREAELGDTASAKQGVTSALGLSPGRDVKVIAAFTLARAGDITRAKALAAELEKNYPTDSFMKVYWLPAIHAAIELNQGNTSQALKDLEVATPYELGGAGTFINYIYPAYLRGQAHLLAHNPNAAAAEFQKLLDHRGIVLNFVTGALAHLQLGRAYATAGDIDKAKTAYKDFFALWKDADSDIPVLSQARVEYGNLR
jgi:tetratricopeptide (TPR) repeat protein